MRRLNLLLVVLAAAAVNARITDLNFIHRDDSCNVEDAEAMENAVMSSLTAASFASCDTNQDQGLQLGEVTACIAQTGLSISDYCFEIFFSKIDQNDDGVIDSEEFETLLKVIGSLAAAEQRKRRSILRTLNDVESDRYDSDSQSNSRAEKSSCTADEFLILQSVISSWQQVAATSFMSVTSMNQLIAQRFASCDANQDQVLQLSEVIACISQASPAGSQISVSCYKDFFLGFDKNGDDVLSLEEFKYLLMSIRSLFKQDLE